MSKSTTANNEARFRQAVTDRGGMVLGRYVNTATSVSLRCRCGHEWQARPNSVLHRGSWCPNCRAERHQSFLSADAENAFRKAVTARGGEVVGEYTGTARKVAVKCSCGHVWSVAPRSVTSMGSWCPACKVKSRLGYGEARFRKAVEAKGGTVLGEYQGSQTKVKVRCSCGHVWDAMPSTVIHQGRWCRKCSRMKTKIRGAGRPHRPSPKVEARFRSIVAAKGGELVGEYSGTAASVRLRCEAWP